MIGKGYIYDSDFRIDVTIDSDPAQRYTKYLIINIQHIWGSQEQTFRIPADTQIYLEAVFQKGCDWRQFWVIKKLFRSQNQKRFKTSLELVSGQTKYWCRSSFLLKTGLKLV